MSVDDSLPSLLDTTRARLEALGEAHSPLGVLLLHLAEAVAGSSATCPECEARIDVPSAQIAQTAREYRATLKELTPDDGGDPFAELVGRLTA